MRGLKYSEILKINKKLENHNELYAYDILLLSNVIVHQAKEITEYTLRKEGINATVELGDYDNIVQESQQQKKLDAVIIFWELSNLIDGLQYKIELLNRDEIDVIEKKIKSEINFTLKNLESCPLILINQFSSFQFSSLSIGTNNLDNLAHRLNSYLESCIHPNLKLVNLEKIIASIGIQNSFDSRYYYSSKAPYTIEFFKAYSQFIKPFFMSANGRSKKALIFDCDNTLWQGILGEDGFNGIEMSPETKNGAIYREIQSIAISLSRRGVLIGLCSKNNLKDVDEVLASHPDMVLRDEHITIKKVNWSDKIINLKEISTELNIGLDSLVFIDDSPFEVNLVRSQLPELKVVKVPSKLHKYTEIMRNILGDFYNLTSSNEDESKTRIYKEQLKRHKIKKTFSNIDEYLSSLCLEISISENSNSIVDRISQISLKTNQFNLTTRRYTETDIFGFIEDTRYCVYSLSVCDKYGDYGSTGLAIILINGGIATIDTFLISCRIIGRYIEFSFIDYIINKMRDNNIEFLNAKYIKTGKNNQTENFYEDCGFDLIETSKTSKIYSLKLEKYTINGKKDYIEVIDE
jgi:FkbH-like protein